MRYAAFAGVVCLLVASLATADILGTVTAAYTGNFTDGTIKLWGDGYPGGIEGYGGVYILNKTAGTGEGALIPDGDIWSFCIEMAEHPSGDPVAYDVVMPSDAPLPPTHGQIGAAGQEYLRELWGRYYDTAILNQADAEAFSACVWEIVYEGSDPMAWDVSAGPGFRCEKLADPGKANGWLASLDGTGPKAHLRALVYEGEQDYLVEIIPEPGTLAMLALGLGGIILRRKT